MASISDNEKKNMVKITLKSSDGEVFEVEKAVAMMSQTLKYMMEDVGADNAIPLPNVTSSTLAKVIDYCRKHNDGAAAAAVAAGTSSTVEVLSSVKAWWEKEELLKMEQRSLFDLILAANYLDIKDLMDLTCQAVADIIKDMKVDEVRGIFGIKSDLTDEEEAEIRKEHAWAFQ